eukprot:COSAG04_NODE_458_length_14025_cov_349.233735_4_plen_280_part_00
MGADRTAVTGEDGVKAVEISAPMSQGFAFMRQKRAFLPDMQFTFSYTINNDAAKDTFYTEFIPSVSSGLAGTATSVNGSILPAIPAATAAPTLIVEDLYADLMFAVPRVSIPRPPSIQVPFQGLSVYHRQLTNNSTFTEVFSGIPASIGLVLVGLRDPTHSVHNNSELYEIGAVFRVVFRRRLGGRSALETSRTGNRTSCGWPFEAGARNLVLRGGLAPRVTCFIAEPATTSMLMALMGFDVLASWSSLTKPSSQPCTRRPEGASTPRALTVHHQRQQH